MDPYKIHLFPSSQLTLNVQCPHDRFITVVISEEVVPFPESAPDPLD